MAFRLVEQYLPGVAGGACYLCRASRRTVHDDDHRHGRPEAILDAGVSIDFEGVLVICETCFREGAQLIGLVDAADRDTAVAAMAEAQARAGEAEAARDEAIMLAEAVVAFRQDREAAASEEPSEPAAPRPRKARAA